MADAALSADSEPSRDEEAGRLGFHADLFRAYLAGAEDGARYPEAGADFLARAADGYVKLWQERNRLGAT